MTNLTPQQKLLQALKLIHLAKELKKAALKKFEPDLSEDDIKKKVNNLFLHARN